MKQSYSDQTYPEKRCILREYSSKSEISYYIDKMTDIINKKIEFRISHDTHERQEIIKNLLQNLDLENAIKDFLIDGYLACEIVWDEKNENITGLRKLPSDSSEEVGYFDNQIVVIDYNSGNYSTLSYVEKLFKPYNQLIMIEQSVVMQSVINASITEVFTVPTRGMSHTTAEDQVGKFIKRYSEKVDWDEAIGELTINGEKHMPYSKQIWLQDSEYGKVSQAIHHINTNVTDVSILNYYKNNLLEASRINDDKFCDKIAKNLSELFLKPMRLMEEKQK